ncbi:hypothetical protein IE81DRAFT_344809 [Ceraceosorus guamensis]|uniref:Glycosyltransferase family 31 protein n=1 Tax=Ceraceosorus guamensis TaxID=1522189 RepID=A0A316W8V4_9BASI|nr:hypothetical protein IE81DRAFT_344809 [Ceraceosorus guamensis]PWN45508.1 hypothetical protein IE81DRAFT_344809 [Ceraceosorus guamensis]
MSDLPGSATPPQAASVSSSTSAAGNANNLAPSAHPSIARHLSHAPQHASPLRSAFQPSPSPPSSTGSPATSSLTLDVNTQRTPMSRAPSYEPAKSTSSTLAPGPAPRRLSEPQHQPVQMTPRPEQYWLGAGEAESSSRGGLVGRSSPPIAASHGDGYAIRRAPSRTGSAQGMHSQSIAIGDVGRPQDGVGTCASGASTVGGYASSVEDHYSVPPSRLISRTPTPVLSGLATSTMSEDSDEGFSSDSRDSAWRGQNRRGLGSFFGWSAALAGAKSGYQAVSANPGIAPDTRVTIAGGKGDKWDTSPPLTPLMEAEMGRRGSVANAVAGDDGQQKWSKLRMQDFTDAGSGRRSGLPRARAPHSRRRRNRHAGVPNPLKVIPTLLGRTFRTFFGPIHPFTIMIALLLIAAFVTSVTMLIIYILNPDKEPLPWRSYCASQMAFPHAYADALAPVDVIVGVMTVDSKFERRSMIRSTYAAHTLPLTPDGRPAANVQVKFILGKVRKAYARRVALEMEAHNDIVVLDMDENMSAKKTLTFLKWAAENATMPFLRPTAPRSLVDAATGDSSEHTVAQSDQDRQSTSEVAWKKVDYVVKADDDAFIVLSELERHLRVSPRRLTYWGYLVKEWFMAGEAYALSMDLVEWLASTPEVERTAKGKEDTRTPQWIAMHPNRSSINWVSEHCYIYDHPKANTPYSHGFLFPDYVERIKTEARKGLSEQEIAWRGGERKSHYYSTVNKWHRKYYPPRNDLTVEEEVEALVEGGGRWAGTWIRGGAVEGGDADDESWQPWAELVYESDDARLRLPNDHRKGGQGMLASDVDVDALTGLPILGPLVSLNGTAGAVSTKSSDTTPQWGSGRGKRRTSEDSLRRSDHAPMHSPLQVEALPAYIPMDPRSRDDAQWRHLPRPTHREGGGAAARLRAKRYLGRPHGGTVIVHYLKKSEYWLETAMAFLGREAMWQGTFGGGPSREYRMWGSPLVRHDGYISEGRSQPRPDAGVRVAAGDEPWSAGSTQASKSTNAAESSSEAHHTREESSISPTTL